MGVKLTLINNPVLESITIGDNLFSGLDLRTDSVVEFNSID